MKIITRNFLIINNVIKLLWNCSPMTFSMMMFSNISVGFTVPATVLVWKNILDEIQIAFSSTNLIPVLIWLFIYFLLDIIGKLLNQVCRYFGHIYAEYLNKYITKIILEKTDKIDMEYYDDSKLYDKIKKVNEESAGRSMSLLSTLATIIKGFTIAISSAILLLQFSPLIMIICIIICVPSLIISMKMANKQYQIYDNRFENMRYIECLKNLLVRNENIKELKVYSINEYFTNYIDKYYSKYIKEDKKILKRYAIENILADLFDGVIVYGLKGLICIKVITTKMTIGNFTLYINCIDNFRVSVSSIFEAVVAIFEDGLYVQNFFELMETETTRKIENSVTFNGEFKTIEFKHVWFKYVNTDNYILKDINLIFKQGENHAIVGLNGSGKTTLIKLLLNLYTPDKGDIFIDNTNMKNIDPKEYYNYISAVFQDYIKYPLDIKKNIGFGDIKNIDNIAIIKKAAEKGGSAEFINKLSLGYETQLQKEWSDSIELSLGQWQKLAISRAFMKDCPIMILDEPTASLDAKSEYDIYEKFKNMMLGKTSILIAHRFSTVRLANKIFVLENGTIIEEGSHEELMTLGAEYATLFNMQAEAYLEESNNE